MDTPANFTQHGYAVIYDLLDVKLQTLLQQLAQQLVERHRAGEATVLAASVNIASVSQQHPERNPGVQGQDWMLEPFIIGDLMTLEPRFTSVLSAASVWTSVAALLGCETEEVVLHFCNLTRKPQSTGPAVGWHRDADNRYFASRDKRTLRLLIPLQAMSAENAGTAVVPGSHRCQEAAIEHALCPHVPVGAGLALHCEVLHGGAPNRSRLERDVLVIQFGVRSSVLSYQADEAYALADRDALVRATEQRLAALIRA
ncbi:phytanoyl-CoA dioxygenase family protein [Pseudomonas rubra]|uniref:Phytanoyl-CoA dioxygenase family protein n=1 Tax=Pseudomonas rubra TaxID=2942627 RepID=A0ABT5PAW2_9PSED|nr:phytanoyl-CoA dioxygenase family protein [Pseudomonas rubra]MDD1015079.1 phytanoyl-CoA dioxygenase family protein [Pseudomonas rubra]MDD1038586.1 phytanoyl-CoA dioxygenase family protein [Pseudomonas rubra]MDD1154722.1 phytanoyl-CoA dioxygenase family protein [Pseudomonas rubra]